MKNNWFFICLGTEGKDENNCFESSNKNKTVFEESDDARRQKVMIQIEIEIEKKQRQYRMPYSQPTHDEHISG